MQGHGRRRSRAEADRLVAEYEQSGQTRGAFCRAHGISLSTLDNYRKRCASAADSVMADPALPKTEQSSSCSADSMPVEAVSAEPVAVAQSISLTEIPVSAAAPATSSLPLTLLKSSARSKRRQAPVRPAMHFVPVEVVDTPITAIAASSQAAVTADREEASCRGATLFIELRYGRRIGVTAGFDAVTLTRLLGVLDRE